MPRLLTRLTSFSRYLLARFIDDRCLQIAGSLTFSTLLSLVPLFAIVVALLSALPFFQQIMVNIKIFLLLNLLPDIAYKIITVYMEQFAANARKLTYVGIGFLLVTALSMLYTVDRSFNDIWRSRRKRPWWMSVVAYLVLLVVAPLLLGAGITITSYLISLSVGVTGKLPWLDDALLKLLSVLGSTVTFFLIFRIVPCRHVPVRNALVGSLIAALLFEALKFLFAWYIKLMPGFSMVYGAFAAIPVFLIWLYLCWCVILIGAQITASLPYWGHETWRRTANRPVDLMSFHQGLAVLGVMEEGRQQNLGTRIGDLAARTGVPVDRLEDLLDQLAISGVVRRERGARYRLVADTSQLTLADAWQWFHGEDAMRGTLPEGMDAVASELNQSLKNRLEQPLMDWLSSQHEAIRKD